MLPRQASDACNHDEIVSIIMIRTQKFGDARRLPAHS
jgi:hypothetical protein